MDVEVLSCRASRCGADGFTLVEALAAVVILGMISLSVLGLFSQSTQLNASGIDYTSLNNAAKDQLEQLVGMPYFDPQNPSSTDWPLAPGLHSQNLVGADLVVTWRVTEHEIVAGLAEPGQVFGADPVNTSTKFPMNEGNVKFLTVTVHSTRDSVLGRRDVTVQGVKLREE